MTRGLKFAQSVARSTILFRTVIRHAGPPVAQILFILFAAGLHDDNSSLRNWLTSFGSVLLPCTCAQVHHTTTPRPRKPRAQPAWAALTLPSPCQTLCP